jgi:hypothetical protein
MDLNEIRRIAGIAIVEAAPSAGMTKDEKTKVVKAAKKGEDIAGKGKTFEKIAKKAASKYGSKEAGNKVAAAVMWKKVAKEGVDYSDEEIDAILESYDDDEDDELTPAEKELAKMGKGLSKQEEKKLANADKKAEDKAVSKTKSEVEESLAYYRLNAGMPSTEIVIEGEQDADVYMVITEAKGGFGDAPTLKDIQVFRDAISAKAFVAKMKGAVKSAQVIGKKFAQAKARAK